MESLPSLRLTANLNALRAGRQTVEQAERAVRGPDVAHHVIDSGGLLGEPGVLDLDTALAELQLVPSEGWFLCLPSPAALSPLRGPVELNRAALQHGEAVVAAAGGLALVPVRVGPAVQWQLYRAERPFAPPTGYDAERALSEAILAAAKALTRLDVASGRRPAERAGPILAPGYGPRQHAAADRALRLMTATDRALRDDGASITSFEADRRAVELRRVQAAARDALIAAASWLHPADDGS